MKDLIQELENYLIENNISYKKFEKSNDFVVQIDGKKYQLFEPMQLKVAGIETSKLFFDERFRWCLDVTDYDGYIIKFGGVWYIFNRGEELDPKLRRVKWIGETSLQGCEDYPYYLGVHGPFELLNGTGNYKDWAKKAKFLKIQKLGICERGSLSGAFKFQSACKKEGIAPIFGIEVPIKNEEKDITYSVKLFAKNENGWQSLLKIDKLLNVDKNGFVSEQDIEENRKDTFLILDPKSQAFETVYRKWNVKSNEIYFQLDSVVYNKEERDKEYLLNLQKFYRSKIKPIAFCDAYYIEKEYKLLKDLLNRVAGKVSYDSDNQYFKNYSEYLSEIYSLCRDEDQFDVLLEEALGNLFYVAENCNFEIETKNRHLPKYIMTEEESKIWPSNRAMFEDLVFQGLEEHSELLDEYGEDVLSERIEKEIDVIEYGGVEDYFLILRDIINWSKNQNILLGAGRGSASGSLVAYLLGITKVNPLKYNLLFERFLNKGRLVRVEKKSMIHIKGDENLDIELDFNAKCCVFRALKKMEIGAYELQQGDELISYERRNNSTIEIVKL